jgi:hypothetical protein
MAREGMAQGRSEVLPCWLWPVEAYRRVGLRDLKDWRRGEGELKRRDDLRSGERNMVGLETIG